MSQTQVDLSEPVYDGSCEQCDKPATMLAKGCSDLVPVLMCDEHYRRGVEVIRSYVKLYQRLNKRVLICGDCHRPILTLDTHLEAKEIT